MQKLQEAEKVAWRIIGDPQACEEKWLPAATVLSDKTDKKGGRKLAPWQTFALSYFVATTGALGTIVLALICLFTAGDSIAASTSGSHAVNGGPVLLATIPIGFSIIFGWLKGFADGGKRWSRFQLWGTATLQALMVFFAKITSDAIDTQIWLGMFIMLFASYPLFAVADRSAVWIKQHTGRLKYFRALLFTLVTLGIWVGFVFWASWNDGKPSTLEEVMTYSAPTITSSLVSYMLFIAGWGAWFAHNCKSSRWQTRCAFAAVSTLPVYGVVLAMMTVGLVHLLVPAIAFPLPLLLMSMVLLPTTMLGTAFGGILGCIPLISRRGL